MLTPSRRVFVAKACVAALATLALISFWAPPPPAADAKALTHSNVDMHVHSTESDGDRSAEDQIRLAAREKLPHVWITDHDYIRDVGRVHALQAVAKAADVTVGFGA